MEELFFEEITESDNDSVDSQSSVDFQGDCLKTCESPFKNRREAALRRKRRLKRLRRNLELSEKARAQAAIQVPGLTTQAAALPGRRRKVKTTWRTKLARKLRGDEEKSYAEIYKLSCREENSSTLLHPLLRLRGPTSLEMAAELGIDPEEAADPGKVPDGHGSGQTGFNKPFPPEILVEILKHAVVFPGQLVHVVSRLDEHHSPDLSHVLAHPDATLDEEGTHLRLLRRFLVGEGPFSLTYAQTPNELLVPLLVCRQWHYIACNLFYSLNQFCFSSLGELGRFAGGIGTRLQRLQFVELFWVGSQDVSFKINSSGRYVSRRSQPLSFLPETSRLKQLGVYLRASHPQHMRRKHETLGKVRFDKHHSINQPNFRLHRDMYAIQGLGNIWCLRGLHEVHFWDYDVFYNGGPTKQCVRDHDFVAQMNEVTGRVKAPADRRMAKFGNLAPLSAPYVPTGDEKRAVKRAIKIERVLDDDDRAGIETHGPGGINDVVDISSDSDDDNGFGFTPEFGPGPGPHGGNDDESDSDDNGPPRGGSHHHNGTGRTTIVLSDDSDVEMAEAPLDGEQGDDEMSDDEQDNDTPMDEAPSEHGGGSASLGSDRRGSSSLFVGPVSPRRASTSPLNTAAAASADSNADRLSREASLFVSDDGDPSAVAVSVKEDDAEADNSDNEKAGSKRVNGRRPLLDWEVEGLAAEKEDGVADSDDDDKDDKDDKE